MVMSMWNGMRNLLLIAIFVVPTTSFSLNNNVVPLALSRQRSKKEHSTSLYLAQESVILGDISNFYSSLLQDHWWPTQSVTGGIFSFVGDAIAQRVAQDENSDREASYDMKRGAIYFFKGLGGGIMWTCWFGVVDPLANQLTSDVLQGHSATPSVEQATRTAISILLEQFLVCPVFYTFWDIPLPAMLRGSPPRQIPAQIQAKLLPLLLANAKVWTPVNLITYNIPTEYRLLFTSFADIFWQSVNAVITSKEIQVTNAPNEPLLPEKLEPEPVKSNAIPAQV